MIGTFLERHQARVCLGSSGGGSGRINKGVTVTITTLAGDKITTTVCRPPLTDFKPRVSPSSGDKTA